jgi:hypothetical protein
MNSMVLLHCARNLPVPVRSSFHREKYSRYQQLTADILHELSVFLTLGSDRGQFGIRQESVPARLPLSHAVPGEHISNLQMAFEGASMK